MDKPTSVGPSCPQPFLPQFPHLLMEPIRPTWECSPKPSYPRSPFRAETSGCGQAPQVRPSPSFLGLPPTDSESPPHPVFPENSGQGVDQPAGLDPQGR